MKRIKKLSLLSLEKSTINDLELRCLKGGSCTCGCHYAGSGGASSGWNDATNFGYGYSSTGGGSEACGCAGSSGASLSDFWKG